MPFGVIGVIYEARPNVSFDVFALCLKSGNAAILKGGSDADASNRAIVQLIQEVLEEFGADPHVVELLPSSREATAALLHAEGWVDLIIPRGSSNLIRYVREEATVPVIETGAGICHTYFDRRAHQASDIARAIGKLSRGHRLGGGALPDGRRAVLAHGPVHSHAGRRGAVSGAGPGRDGG